MPMQKNIFVNVFRCQILCLCNQCSAVVIWYPEMYSSKILIKIQTLHSLKCCWWIILWLAAIFAQWEIIVHMLWISIYIFWMRVVNHCPLFHCFIYLFTFWELLLENILRISVKTLHTCKISRSSLIGVSSNQLWQWQLSDGNVKKGLRGNFTKWNIPNGEIKELGLALLTCNSMSNNCLLKEFLTGLLIGWQHSCQPIRNHVRKWPSTSSDFNK